MYHCLKHHIYLENEKCTSAVRSTENGFLVKTHLCKLRVILRSRVLRGVYSREGHRLVTPLQMPGSYIQCTPGGTGLCFWGGVLTILISQRRDAIIRGGTGVCFGMGPD